MSIESGPGEKSPKVIDITEAQRLRREKLVDGEASKVSELFTDLQKLRDSLELKGLELDGKLNTLFEQRKQETPIRIDVEKIEAGLQRARTALQTMITVMNDGESLLTDVALQLFDLPV